MFKNRRGTGHRAQMKNYAKSIAKNQNGITLIALVITIIVLLILAGISLSLIMGEGGILTRATNAKKANDIAGAKEQVELLAVNYSHDYLEQRYGNGNTQAGANVGEYVANKIKEYATANNKINETYTISTSTKDEQTTITLTSQDGFSTTGTVQNDGSINWDGTTSGGTQSASWTQDGDNITNGTVTLKIGDYVNYDPTDGATVTSYTSPSAKSGWDNDQVFNVATYKTKGYGWRVLGVENGKILLIASEGIGPDSGGLLDSTNNTTSYILGGRTGYQNGVTELNKIGALYGQGKYASGGRSINVNDVNKLTGYDPDVSPKFSAGETNEYGNKVTYFWLGSYYIGSSSANGENEGDTESSNFYWFNISSSNWENKPSSVLGNIADIISTNYSYGISDKLGIDNGLKMSLLLGEHPVEMWRMDLLS